MYDGVENLGKADDVYQFDVHLHYLEEFGRNGAREAEDLMQKLSRLIHTIPFQDARKIIKGGGGINPGTLPAYGCYRTRDDSISAWRIHHGGPQCFLVNIPVGHLPSVMNFLWSHQRRNRYLNILVHAIGDLHPVNELNYHESKHTTALLGSELTKQQREYYMTHTAVLDEFVDLQYGGDAKKICVDYHRMFPEIQEGADKLLKKKGYKGCKNGKPVAS